MQRSERQTGAKKTWWDSVKDYRTSFRPLCPHRATKLRQVSWSLIGRLPLPRSAAWASACGIITALWCLQTSNNCVCVNSWEKKTIWKYKGDTAVWHFVFKLFIFVDFDQWALLLQPSQSGSFYWIKISKRLNHCRVFLCTLLTCWDRKGSCRWNSWTMFWTDESYLSCERLTALMTDSMAASGPRILSRLWKASAAPSTGWEGDSCSAAETETKNWTSVQTLSVASVMMSQKLDFFLNPCFGNTSFVIISKEFPGTNK